MTHRLPCPATTLDRLSSKDVIGPALVILEPLSNKAVRHIAVSTLDLRFSEDDRDPAIVRMESLYPVQVSGIP